MEEKEMEKKIKKKSTKSKTSKKPQVLVQKKKDNTKKGKKIIFGAIVGVVVVLLVILIMVINKSTDCHKIAKEVSKHLDDTTIMDEGIDNDYKYSYVESTIIYTEEVGTQEDGKYAVAIAKYNSSDEAKIKAKYLEDQYKLFHNKIDGTLLEQIDDIEDYFDGEEDLIFTNGIYLIRIDSHYKDQYDELQKEIKNILKKYDTKDVKKTDYDKTNKYWENELSKLEKSFSDAHTEVCNAFRETIDEYIEEIDKCKGADCEQYLNEVLEFKDYSEVKDEITMVQNKYDEVMNRKKEIVNTINISIAKVESNLNQTDYDNVKKQIDELDDSYYDEYKTGWTNKLNAVEEKVYKNSCSSYGYKEVLRTPENYKGKKAYWFGVVSQKVSSTQYRVGVDCTKYKYIDGYSCENTIYVSYYGDTNLIEDDVIKLWGTMDGTVTYTTVLGSSLTIPSFYAKYVSIQ